MLCRQSCWLSVWTQRASATLSNRYQSVSLAHALLLSVVYALLPACPSLMLFSVVWLMRCCLRVHSASCDWLKTRYFLGASVCHYFGGKREACKLLKFVHFHVYVSLCVSFDETFDILIYLVVGWQCRSKARTSDQLLGQHNAAGHCWRVEVCATAAFRHCSGEYSSDNWLIWYSLYTW